MPLVALWMIFLAALSFASPALADGFILELDLNTSLNCANTDQNLFQNKPTDASACNSDNFMLRTFCTFETTLGMVITKLLCHLQSAWQGPVVAAIVLCMVLTGVAFTLGLLNFTLKELAAFLFKITLVAAFALNSSFIMNIAYKFFINVTKNTVSAFASYMDNSPEIGGSDTFEKAGEGMNNFVGGTVFNSLIDNPAIIGCGIFIPLLLLVAFYFIPGLFLLVIKALSQFFMVVVRALAGYLFSLTMITMLVACLPIFISFALFKLTREIFDDYLKQLGQSCLNIVVIFLFIAGVAQIDDKMFSFVDRISQMVRLDSRLAHTGTMIFFPVPYCSICKPRMIPYTGKEKYLHDLGFSQVDPNNPCATRSGALRWSKIILEDEFINYFLLNSISLYLLAVLFYKLLLEAPKFANQLGGQRYAYNVLGGGRKAEAMGGSPLAGGTIQQNFMKGMDQNIQDKTRLGLFATNINPFKDARSLWRGVKNPKAALRNSPKNALSALGKRASIITGSFGEGVNSVKYGASRYNKVQRKEIKKRDAAALRRQEERIDQARNKLVKVQHLESKIQEMHQRGTKELAEKNAKLQAELKAAQDAKNQLHAKEIEDLKAELLASRKELEAATSPLKEKLAALRESEDPKQEEIAKLEKQLQEISVTRQREDAKLGEYLKELQQAQANFKKDEIEKLQKEMKELATKQQSHEKNLQYYQQVLGATQNKLATAEMDKRVTKYNIKKARKETSHVGGGLKEELLYDPIHIDAKGQAKRSSVHFKTNVYKENHTGLTNEEYDHQQNIEKTSWYVLMKP